MKRVRQTNNPFLRLLGNVALFIIIRLDKFVIKYGDVIEFDDDILHTLENLDDTNWFGVEDAK